MPKVPESHLAARRDQILAAAAVRFAREGFHRTSMQDVIDEAGLSPGAVYRYFRGKDEVITAIALESMGTVASVVQEAVETDVPLADLVGRIPRLFDTLPQAEERIRLAVQVWGEVLRNPSLASELRAGLTDMKMSVSCG